MIAPESIILMVDDDPDVRDGLRLCLEAEGYQVHPAEHGRAALALLDDGLRPDVILLDLMMPVMNGFEFLQTLRARSEWHHVRILILSSYQGYAAEALQGVFRVLSKPVQLDVLYKELELALAA